MVQSLSTVLSVFAVCHVYKLAILVTLSHILFCYGKPGVTADLNERGRIPSEFPPPPFRELGPPVKFTEKRIFLIKDFNIRELVDFLRSHTVSNNSKNLKTFSVCMSAEKTMVGARIKITYSGPNIVLLRFIVLN